MNAHQYHSNPLRLPKTVIEEYRRKFLASRSRAGRKAARFGVARRAKIENDDQLTDAQADHYLRLLLGLN